MKLADTFEWLPAADPNQYEPGAWANLCERLHDFEGSTAYDPQTGYWLVWRYDDAQDALGGTISGVSNGNALDSYVSRARIAAHPSLWGAVLHLATQVVPATANAVDKAEHRSVREAILAPDSPVSLNYNHAGQNHGELVSRRVRQAANMLGIRAVDGTVDISGVFASRLAAGVIAEILGIPPEQEDQVRGWAEAQASLLGRDLQGKELVRAVRGLTELSRTCQRLIADRSIEPANDMASLLARLPSRKLASSAAMNLIAAGYITTKATIPNAVRRLLSDPDRQYWNMLHGPELVDPIVEELLRLETGLVGWKRKTIGEVALRDGSIIPPDRQVLVLMGVGNRSPEVFENPNDFALRPNAKPSLTFGFGTHYCVGAALARLELKETLVNLRERYPNARISRRAELMYQRDPMFRVLDSLPVELAA